uniref:Transmembrane protein n=2 Tax=Burkholderiaceae TaxID=119060 RepID=Q472Y4_CUPPJ
MSMQRTLIILGGLLMIAGVAWPWLSRLPFGRLPGDIHILRDGFTFYFPITTCIVISLLLSVLFWLLHR